MPAVLSLDFICFWCVSALMEQCHFMVIKKNELTKRKSMDRRDVILVFPLFFLAPSGDLIAIPTY